MTPEEIAQAEAALRARDDAAEALAQLEARRALFHRNMNARAETRRDLRRRQAEIRAEFDMLKKQDEEDWTALNSSNEEWMRLSSALAAARRKAEGIDSTEILTARWINEGVISEIEVSGH